MLWFLAGPAALYLIHWFTVLNSDIREGLKNRKSCQADSLGWPIDGSIEGSTKSHCSAKSLFSPIITPPIIVAMEEMDYRDFVSKDASVKILKKITDNAKQMQMQMQCDCLFWASELMKMHSVEKWNKCNQCNFALSNSSNLKTHSGEKSNNVTNMTLPFLG